MLEDPNIKYELDCIAHAMGRNLTDEQMDFASDFTKSTIAFSDAGTGKTFTMLAGLAMLQMHYHIPGSKICAMSFTNNATDEMKVRYNRLANLPSLQVSSKVNFKTVSSLAATIVREGYPGVRIVAKTISTQDDYEFYMDKLKRCGILIDTPSDVYKIIKNIEHLNSCMIYDDDHMRSSKDFIELNLPLEKVQMFRKHMFTRVAIMGTMPQGDIPLYAYASLIRNPEIGDTYKNMFKVMVVDEFQDMSLLNLEILRQLTDTLIVVGDMKQLIYGFSGASEQTVTHFHKYYPDARKCFLTKSFRCAQGIADYAAKVVAPNMEDASKAGFSGQDKPCIIDTKNMFEMDWKKLVDDVLNADARHSFMLLYRNNMSAIPIVEELYKRRVPYRIEYTPIMHQPYYNTLFDMLESAVHPEDYERAERALAHFPEYRKSVFNNPLIRCMKDNKMNIFDAFRYTQVQETTKALISVMYEINKRYAEGREITYLLGPIARAYEQYIYKSEAWSLHEPLEYYKTLVAPFTHKSYDVFVTEEYDKKRFADECTVASTGIRLFTMHGAKGLEADTVYLLDCDEGLFPNKMIFDKYSEKAPADCVRNIRQERNLLYTAITRAKTELHILYRSKLTTLISDPLNNEYTRYEEENKFNDTFDDFENFALLYNLSVGG